jgi:hypothetical protein
LVKGLGKIAISPDHSISNVFLVDSLDYNLLSVSQLCKIGYNCLFTDVGVTVFRRSDDSTAFKGVLEGQLYLVNFDKVELDTCLIATSRLPVRCDGLQQYPRKLFIKKKIKIFLLMVSALCIIYFLI